MTGREEIVKFVEDICPKIIDTCTYMFSFNDNCNKKLNIDINSVSKMIKNFDHEIILEFANKFIKIYMEGSNQLIIMGNFRLHSLIIPSNFNIHLTSCNINNLFTDELNIINCGDFLSQNLIKKCDDKLNLKIVDIFNTNNDILLLKSKIKNIHKN